MLGFAKNTFRPPGNSLEELRDHSPEPDQVITPVESGPENKIGGVEQDQGPFYQIGGEIRDIRSNQKNFLDLHPEGVFKGTEHALTEIALALLGIQKCRSEPAAEGFQRTARIPDFNREREAFPQRFGPAQSMLHHLPLQFGRSGRAQGRDQAGLALSRLRKRVKIISRERVFSCSFASAAPFFVKEKRPERGPLFLIWKGP